MEIISGVDFEIYYEYNLWKQNHLREEFCWKLGQLQSREQLIAVLKRCTSIVNNGPE